MKTERNRKLHTFTKCCGVTIIVSIHKTCICDFKYRYRDNKNILRVSRKLFIHKYNDFNQSITRFFNDETGADIYNKVNSW